ncbi:unnamed protein product [Sphenostylis stenocarpa]|uniref:Uncharacterized protein n=1 Tax=Sphenostylis stenocarpa TaxID=92480 RepID=A0AA86SRI7_9FABA|nr:unnamed protein product [Sphenostylis stenocarpa]
MEPPVKDNPAEEAVAISHPAAMKNLTDGDDSASITLKKVVREFLAAKEKHFHAEYFWFLSADEDLSMDMGERGLKRKAEEEVSNCNTSKWIKSE